jgi:ferredoxin
MGAQLPSGCFVRIDKPALEVLIGRLKTLGYRVVGPMVVDGAVVYGDLESAAQLPIGMVDDQEAGKYRLQATGDGMYFSYVVGPHSLKNFLFPPQTTLVECVQIDGAWQIEAPVTRPQPLAAIGVRSCELHALAIQDKVFLGGAYVEPHYAARREGLFIVAVQCGRAAATCFCASMKTGPRAMFGYDLALTELPDHFVVEIGTERGAEVLAMVPWRPCTKAQIDEAQLVPLQAERQMVRDRRRGERSGNGHPTGAAAKTARFLDTTGIRDLLLNNLEHPRWEETAQRCLACGNCTMVCPTCFCSTVRDVASLNGDAARRERLWESCFTDEHSYMNSGAVRKSTKARYRQWLTHKLATWIDQFGTSGCVGCGRCITWCPVGIDLTEEVAAIRGRLP